MNEKLRLLRSHGNTRNPKDFIYTDLSTTDIDGSSIINPWYYEMQELSYNYRLTDFQSALGISQLKRLDSFIKERNLLANYYEEELEKLNDNKILPLANFSGTNHGRHLFVVKIPMQRVKGGRA